MFDDFLGFDEIIKIADVDFGYEQIKNTRSYKRNKSKAASKGSRPKPIDSLTKFIPERNAKYKSRKKLPKRIQQPRMPRIKFQTRRPVK
jgi:hypothetical protein